LDFFLRAAQKYSVVITCLVDIVTSYFW